MKTKSQGVAIITALVVVFLVMAIVTSITVQNYRTISKMTHQKIQDQAYSVLHVAIDFGRAGLATSAATSRADTLTDIWAQPIPPTQMLPGVEMSGYITDEQSKFNINDLVSNGQINQTVLAQFQVLLTYLKIPSTMADAIANYMAAPYNETDIMSQYTSGTPAYRPAGRTLTDLSELLLVKNMQPAWVTKLNAYVTAIPQNINLNESQAAESQAASQPQNNTIATNTGSVQINVNTASAEVIAAKSGIPITAAQRMTVIRSDKPFYSSTDITNFLSNNGIMLSKNNNTIALGTMGTTSQYFTIHAIVDFEDDEFKWVAFINRPARTGQWPQILWQHLE